MYKERTLRRTKNQPGFWQPPLDRFYGEQPIARIPDQELERLKREVSLARLIEGQGYQLISQGKDLACRCPWHEGR